MNDSSAEKIKGMIPYPCCPSEKAMVYEGSTGRSSYKCPRCHKFAIFDYDKMKSYPAPAARGAVNRFSDRSAYRPSH